MNPIVNSISLERGWHPGFSNQGDLRIIATVAGQPQLPLNEIPTVLFHWSPSSCTATFLKEGRAIPIHCVSTTAGVEVDLQTLVRLPHSNAMKVISQAPDWTLQPNLDLAQRSDEQVLFLPPCGWNGHRWLDGWMGHLSGKAGVYSFVPPGGRARVLLPTDPIGRQPLASALALAEFDLIESARQCIIASIRARVHDHLPLGPLHISGEYSTDEALVAVLCAQSFAGNALTFTGSEPKKLLPRPWKGLLDSLGATYRPGQMPSLPLRKLTPLIPPSIKNALIRHMNGPTRIFDYREWRSINR